LVGTARPLWSWFQRRRAAEWAIGDGRIESSSVTKPNFSLTTRRGHYVSELHYSYFAVGSQHFGSYRREFPTENEAAAFVRNLEGLPVSIHYDPAKPARSLILEPDAAALMQRRAPTLASIESSSRTPVPDWLRPFLWLFAWLSCIGLIASLWVHVGALMGRRVAPESFFWILHVGIFVVWIPSVLIAQRLVGSLNRKDFWKVVLADSPVWMRYIVYGFGGYAIVNFLLFMMNAPSSSGGDSPPSAVWRGFSGHWMAFYSAGFAILYAAARRERDSDRSPRDRA
jgi:hypothetical protein